MTDKNKLYSNDLKTISRRELSERELIRKRRLERRKKQARKKKMVITMLVMTLLIMAFILWKIVLLISSFFVGEIDTVADEVTAVSAEDVMEDIMEDIVSVIEMPEIDEQLITINEYSRPGIALDSVDNIVIHYTGNPGTTAQQNRDYYEELSVTGETSVSSNFIIGLEGEIILCVPMDEVAYASNEANSTSLSIEVCHWDETGEFTEEAYESVVHLAAWLCQEFGLEADDVIRHYDVTGKECPLYYVENEDEWIALKNDIDIMLNGE